MRKLFLSLVLSFLVFCAYAEGISNYKELLAFAKAVNKEADISAWLNDKGEVCLKADIDMKKGKKFPTIEVLKVTFDGCGHKLYNWNTKAALFNKVEPEAAVKNLTIDASCCMTVKTRLNQNPVHISYIAYVNRGHIVNCVNHGSIDHTAEEATKAIYIGAIAALNLNVVHNCKNTASLSSRFNYTQHAKYQSLRLGGIVGTCYGKQLSGAVVSNCVNTGNISYMGDYPSNNVAGIVGESSKVPVKYCVNRGAVAAVGLPITTPKFSGAIRVAGITGWANADVTCCDNFGVIAGSGTHSIMSAGICARPNMTLNLVNCMNYGAVSANTSASSSVGGIAGNAEVYVLVTEDNTRVVHHFGKTEHALVRIKRLQILGKEVCARLVKGRCGYAGRKIYIHRHRKSLARLKHIFYSVNTAHVCYLVRIGNYCSCSVRKTKLRKLGRCEHRALYVNMSVNKAGTDVFSRYILNNIGVAIGIIANTYNFFVFNQNVGVL